MAYVQFYEDLPTGLRLKDLFVAPLTGVSYASGVTPQLAAFQIRAKQARVDVVYSGPVIGADQGQVSSLAFNTGADPWISYGSPSDLDVKFGYGGGLAVFHQGGIAAASTVMAGDDELRGSSKGDYLEGYAGNDTLNGGRGWDTLVGGAGDDLYYVDDRHDRVSEVRYGGYDTVVARTSYALSATPGVERLEAAAGKAKIALTGNAYANLLVGNGGANVLDGGRGTDTLEGGRGNDTYIIKDRHDLIVEAPGGGTDVVLAGVSYALKNGSAVEGLSASGSASISLAGNGLSNTITGNAGNNLLKGMAGNDTIYGADGQDRLLGGAGHDKLFGGLGDDVIAGGAGNDALYGDVGSDILQGGAGNDSLYGGPDNNVMAGDSGNDTIYGSYNDDRIAGGSGNDLVYGDSGNDTVSGGAGRDSLSSGEGYDTFSFDAELDAQTNVDTLLDFNPWADRIVLKASAFIGIGGAGPLSEGAFWVGPKAHAPADRIIYDKDAGTVSYDPDGIGAAAPIKFAIVGKIDLSYAAFYIV